MVKLQMLLQQKCCVALKGLKKNEKLASEESSVELLRFIDDDNEVNDDEVDNDIFEDYEYNAYDNSNESAVKVKANDFVSTTSATIKSKRVVVNNVDSNSDDLSLNDQVRLLTKQLNALMTRRREDYEMLEHNLRKSLRITADAAADTDLRNELEQLRLEVKSLRGGHINTNKERLTVEWLQQSVSEIRKQLIELQQIATKATKDVNFHTQNFEDLATVRNDFQQLKLEVVSLQERQQQSEVYVQELREEIMQQEEDYKRLLHNLKGLQQSDVKAQTALQYNGEQSEDIKLNTDSLADHKRRHCHFQRQEIHELQLAQRSMRRKLNELKYHRIGERVRSIEIEQHRLADANFNLSRQIATLDKLHLSMLELLEDVEGLQTKIDKNVPELRHEISKLEFTNAQLTSEQNMLREESKNMARSIQAMAMSVSTLQDERDGVRKMETTVTKLQAQADRSQSVLQDVQRALTHRRKADNKLQPHGIYFNGELQNNTNNANSTNITNFSQNAETLVEKLEKVELQYESIINKLPQDCSEVQQSTEGLYLIAPAGQHHPLMAHCTADGWTTVQRRYDGSADFNRSWEDYAAGFGTPAGEYWIGNEQLHHLTVNNCTELRIIMQDIYDNVWQAQYSNFYIASRADGFRLHISGYRGNASDALDYQQGMQFSAIDVDRDISQTHCAANYEGGWWFSHCQHANLNGRYNLGLTWFDASRNEWIAVKSSQMQIKRQSAAVCAYRNAKRNAATATDVTSATTIISSEIPTTTTTTTHSSGV